MLSSKFLDRLKNTERVKLNIPEFDRIINNTFAKKVRQKFEMTQKVFASSIGVSEKTIEKWESGENRIKGAAARLLYLLDKNPELMNDIYSYEYVSPTLSKSDIYSNTIEYDQKTTERIITSTFSNTLPANIYVTKTFNAYQISGHTVMRADLIEESKESLSFYA